MGLERMVDQIIRVPLGALLVYPNVGALLSVLFLRNYGRSLDDARIPNEAWLLGRMEYFNTGDPDAVR